MAMSAGVFMAIGFTFLPFRYRRCPVFTGINPSGGRPLLAFTLGFILLAVCGTSLFTSSVMTVMAKVRALLVGELG